MRTVFLLSASIALAAPPALKITTATLPVAYVGLPYSATLQATGGKAPYRWTFAGTLPTGITLSQGGIISGTPAQVESFSIFAIVTDRWGAQVSKAFTIESRIPPTPKFLPTVLMNIFPGVPYSQKLPVDSTVAYTCAVTGGTLPAGLTLSQDCVLSGTVQEFYSVEVRP